MELPLHSATRVETELDTLLVNIEIIALTRAREIVPKHAVGDVAHDVVLHCLIKIRDGHWGVLPKDLTRCVRRMVQSRAVDEFRGCHRRDGRDSVHARNVTDARKGSQKRF